MARIGDRQRSRTRPRRAIETPVLILALIVLLVVGLVGAAVGSAALRSAKAEQDDVVQLSLSPEPPESAESGLGADAVEVPDLVGLGGEEAETILSAAELGIQVKTRAAQVGNGVVQVVEQEPAPGTLVDIGTTVTLTQQAVADTGLSSTAEAKQVTSKKRTWVVCIDPGHQGRSDSSPEPIGPGSKKTKARATGGATGVSTGVPEYEVALQISMNLRERLKGHGVKVVMTRTTNDVNLSNAERAAIANKAKADLFLRVHANGSPDTALVGAATTYPGKNKWTARIATRSKRAARRIQSALVAETGAVDRGVLPQTGLTGFNWSKVPVVLVESGYLSHSVEDRLLVSPHYQDKVAEGIASGVLAYLEAEESR